MIHLLCDWFLLLYHDASPFWSHEEQRVVLIAFFLVCTYNKLESLSNNLDSPSFLLLLSNELHIPINRCESFLLMLMPSLINDVECWCLGSWFSLFFHCSCHLVVLGRGRGRNVTREVFDWVCWFVYKSDTTSSLFRPRFRTTHVTCFLSRTRWPDPALRSCIINSQFVP